MIDNIRVIQNFAGKHSKPKRFFPLEYFREVFFCFCFSHPVNHFGDLDAQYKKNYPVTDMHRIWFGSYQHKIRC